MVNRIKIFIYNIYYFPLLKKLSYIRSKKQSFLPPSSYYKEITPFENLLSIHEQYLKQTGWLESKAENSSVFNGQPIPWISYSFLNFINMLVLKDKNRVEFGGGASTHYFVSKVKNITTFESDSEYLNNIKTNFATFSIPKPIDTNNCDFEINRQLNINTSIS